MAGNSRSQLKLVTAQLFSGAGIASGYAVGGILAEQISGRTAMAGFAQMSTIFGAGIIAYPLATLAGRRGRRTALSLGFGIGALGAIVVLLGVTLQILPLFLVGMMMCGSCTAAGLQARYAAVDNVRPGAAARAMSVVVWATTVGAVLGPNFTGPGAEFGESLGMNPLAGPYVISMVAFVIATIAASTLPKGMGMTSTGAARAATPTAGSAADNTAAADDTTAAADDEGSSSRLTLRPALRYAMSHPVPLFAIVAIITGQMMMTNVMVMTPVHMDHQGFTLGVIGIVISVHIAGMYGLSPLFGWIADRWGPGTLIAGGVVVFALTILFGVIDAMAPVSSMGLLTTALTLLGVGWSMFLIGGSTLLTASVPQNARVTLQGASDAAMNLGGALMAATAGLVQEMGGFLAINLMATGVLVIAVIFGVRAAPLLSWPGRPAPAPAPATETRALSDVAGG